MTVLQLIALGVGVANCVAIACRLDQMTWRTHRWRPQVATVGLGLAALGLMGWTLHDPAPMVQVIGLWVISIVLLHTLPAYQGPRAAKLRRDYPA